MNRNDRKLQLLSRLCPGLHPVELVELGRRVELTEHSGGALVAPAGCAGQWVTAVLEGELSTTAPVATWRAPAVLTHGPETALVAVTDVRLLTVAAADLPAALLPWLLPDLPADLAVPDPDVAVAVAVAVPLEPAP